ncbi:hypothetical protein IFU39_16295 [Paenibacillus sp. CFBP 13594]|uniref:hypothetical protein n=1 Tax=Paenibacillus sp. CFBP 13594 TaxID=2774037 RepID=UPI00178144E5|nr:hypothetical protein [Paenibacillus sp. CFBP 13594]MBD8839373.1 hypothetical protein [Paenibacillus sp. CFBP 13594]
MIIQVDRLPLETKSIVEQQTTDVEVDLYWSNGCNSEGEDYYELEINSMDYKNHFHSKSGWGEILNLEQALEELD